MNDNCKSFIKIALFFIISFTGYIFLQIILTSIVKNESLNAFICFFNALFISSFVLLMYKKIFNERIIFYKNIRGLILTVIYSVLIILFLDYSYELHSIIYFTQHWLFCFAFAVATALVEEMLFRGVLFDYISKKISVYWGVFVIGCIFGLLHLINLVVGQKMEFMYIFNCICAGVFMCILYYEYGLLSSFMYHAFWNMIFSQSVVEYKKMTGIILLLTGIVIFIFEKKLKSKESPVTFQ